MSSIALTCAICNLPMGKPSKTSRPQGEASHVACRNVAHGSTTFYTRGCRCDICRAGQNDRLKAYHAKRRQELGLIPQACTLCGDPLAMYTKGARPFHRACKDKAPRWMKDGLPEPAPRIKVANQPKQPRDLRSAIRAGYEDGDYPKFLAGLAAKVVVTPAGCWEWQGQSKKNYPIQMIGKKYAQVHRLVIEAREGKPLGVLAAHHKCGNSICVSPEHLQPVTQRENVAEMLARTSLEARILELERALAAIAPHHPALNRVSHMAA